MFNEAMLLEQNKRLRARVDELEETVRQFAEERKEVTTLPPGLPHLTKLEERAFMALWSRRGIVDKITIYADMYGDNSEVDMKIVDVMICHLRRKFTAPTHPKILTHWSRGYSIEGREGVSNAAAVRSDVASMIASELAA